MELRVVVFSESRVGVQLYADGPKGKYLGSVWGSRVRRADPAERLIYGFDWVEVYQNDVQVAHILGTVTWVTEEKQEEGHVVSKPESMLAELFHRAGIGWRSVTDEA